MTEKASTTSNGKVTIKIPRPLYNKIAQAIAGKGYNSVTDFVVYVLRDLVAGSESAGTDTYRATELEKVRQHLRALGTLLGPDRVPRSGSDAQTIMK
jgi:hypothetical protein